MGPHKHAGSGVFPYPTREGETIQALLKGFSGVLVSDF
jgi:hypothetical protein